MNSDVRTESRSVGALADLGLGALARNRKVSNADFSMAMQAAEPSAARPETSLRGEGAERSMRRGPEDGFDVAQAPRSKEAEATDRPERPAADAGPKKLEKPPAPEEKAEAKTDAARTQEAQVRPEVPTSEGRTEGATQAAEAPDKPSSPSAQEALALLQADLNLAIALAAPTQPLEGTATLANHLVAPPLAASELLAAAPLPVADLPSATSSPTAAEGQLVGSVPAEAKATSTPQALVAMAAAMNLGPAKLEIKALRPSTAAEGSLPAASSSPAQLSPASSGATQATATLSAALPPAGASAEALPASSTLALDGGAPEVEAMPLPKPGQAGAIAGFAAALAKLGPQSTSEVPNPAPPELGDAPVDLPTGLTAAGTGQAEARSVLQKAEAKGNARAADLVHQVAKVADALKAQPSKVLTIQLSPEHLGKVEIRLVAHQGQVSAELRADSAATHKLFESQAGALAQRLSELGVKVDRVEVTAQGQSLANDAGGQNAWNGREEQRPNQGGQNHPSGQSPWRTEAEEGTEAANSTLLGGMGLEGQFEAVA